ncbi:MULTISPECIES: retropepsin-like aspartic protease family protein [Alteromonadaceae]|uniref:retropepsin-like aspartic protease family protein n=1 Tax=Alteromonadaceae TaxID=72275 RepID=UPI001C09D2AB|nr:MULTISPECIES: TIGR02281 family clan AA aspartic protease [Aliiglaciecola]MBU2876922.1 TIGR02281 family clan AA aspartic protease [Aliiglaciecola lipolytica]MDO6712612.1 TIGR02281 family clan AA aspartic protease [Aliiglaciecola sp. 2_MG-2023]MDO6753780.1 TIGR02281 family clan AA aspartic protease [Aliiglaciecola sp. 1_MG-2023]
MEQNQSPAENSTKIGKWMFFAFWIVGLLLLSLFFGDRLEKQKNPNQNPQSQLNNGAAEVKLKRNRMGHYVASGLINGQPVTFLLDTGATNVSVPAHLANELGLVGGARYSVSTANGNVTVAQTNIQQLDLGSIRINDVRASINPGMLSDEILLGMSVLKQLEFTQRGDWLILRH